MEAKVITSINDLGYAGLDSSKFEEILNEGPKNIEYTKIVNYLTGELRVLCKIDEMVNVIVAPEDAMSFIMELSSFLKELGCPHDCLTEGYVSDRLTKNDDKILLLDYLVTELMAARILHESLPDKTIQLKLQESTQACNLRKMLMTLNFPKPPATITVNELFNKLNTNVTSVVQKCGDELLGHPICNFAITPKHWVTLDKIQKELHDEYTLRREMILKRLDCTVQSFQWSDRMKGKDALINQMYTEKRKELKVEPNVNISDLLSARTDLAIMEKTSNASVRKNTKSAVNQVIIGQVPDRGGRTTEQAAPPKEMPSWASRTADPTRGNRGGQGGRGRGNRGGNNNMGGAATRGYNRGAQRNIPTVVSNNERGGGHRQTTNYDAAGSYQSAYGGNYDGNYEAGYSHQAGYSHETTYTQQGAYTQASAYQQHESYDSAGHYNADSRRTSGAGYQSYDNEPKRPKTYDNAFHANKETYADQYVQESQNNQQFHSGRGNRGRGYNRGHRGYQQQNYY